MPTTVFQPLFNALVHVLEGAGITRENLLRETGLVQRLEGFESLKLGDFARLQEAAIRLTRDDALGLLLAEQATAHHFEAVGHMLAHAGTLREAIDLAAHYGRGVIEDYHLELSVCADRAVLIFRSVRSTPLADRMLADFVMAGMLRLLQAFVGPRAEIIRACFAYPAPADARRYNKLFQAPVLFSQPETALELPRHYLQASSRTSNSEILAVLREHADKVLERRLPEQTDAAAVSRYLRACAPSHVPSMSRTARNLGISTRSLRRRLADEGVSYRELARSALESSATDMLRHSRRPVEEIAARLGFTDVSSFQRAFKRWTGVTPREFVERAARSSTSE